LAGAWDCLIIATGGGWEMKLWSAMGYRFTRCRAVFCWPFGGFLRMHLDYFWSVDPDHGLVCCWCYLVYTL